VGVAAVGLDVDVVIVHELDHMNEVQSIVVLGVRLEVVINLLGEGDGKTGDVTVFGVDEGHNAEHFLEG